MLRKDLKYYIKFEKNISDIKKINSLMIKELKSLSLNVSTVKEYEKIIDTYKKNFNEYV